jgi:hypothetical protein
LRWGRYEPRWITGLACITLGTGAVQLTSAYSLPFLLVGALAHAVGWAIMPASMPRRVVVTLPALAASILLLARGASFTAFFVVLLVAWLLVRQRPAISYLVLMLPFVASLLLANVVTGYSDAWVALGTGALVVVASAWIARWLAMLVALRRRIPADISPAAAPQPSKLSAVP